MYYVKIKIPTVLLNVILKWLEACSQFIILNYLTFLTFFSSLWEFKSINVNRRFLWYNFSCNIRISEKISLFYSFYLCQFAPNFKYKKTNKIKKNINKFILFLLHIPKKISNLIPMTQVVSIACFGFLLFCFIIFLYKLKAT